VKKSIFLILCLIASGWLGVACKKAGGEAAPSIEKKAEASTGAPSDKAGADTKAVRIPADSPQLQQVKVEPVKTMNMPGDEVVSPGQIEANPNRISRVLLPLGGRVTNVNVKIGDRVKAGQVLLMVESPDGDAAIKDYIQAEASLADNNADYNKAQHDYDRVQDLFEHNAVAKKEVLSAEQGVAHTRSGVESAKALRDQTRRRLEMLGLEPGRYGQKIAVRAPIGGRILDLAVAQGEYRNDTSTSLMTIADLDSVLVTANVPESQIRFIRLGESVQVELSAYPGETFTARVKRIADGVDPQTRTIKVQAELPNTGDRFRPEMFAQIRHSHQVASLPAIPGSAVVQRDGRTVVLVEKERGAFEVREVKLGQRSGDLVAVSSGLTGGERIVTDGVMLLLK
jgi:cobalt-zinc-cadmium efflux system membrane fusion protein